jgi:hypothetical protein
MRLTYKILSKIISDKLNSCEFKHDTVDAWNPKHRGQDLEAGAACINYSVTVDGDSFVMYSGQWISEIQDIINSGEYIIEMSRNNRFNLVDTWIWFKRK